MSRETQTPQIPQVTEENLLEVVRSLKEIMEVREGRRGDELDELVTYRDLVSLGLVKKLSTGGYGDNTGTVDTPVIVQTDDSNVPPAPTNLTVRAVYNVIALTWTVPSYRNHGVTEIWRAKVDDLTKAAKIGDTAGVHFSDPIADSGTYWYWVRNISMAAVAGPYNSQSGTSATAMASVYDILKDIAADIESSALMRDLRSRVEGLEDGTFVPKYINDVVVRADEIARESKTLVSRSNSSLAYAQQVMETVSGMRARYTVKLGVGGHVAGFGLAVEPNAAGTATSEFIVAADRFAIVGATTQQATAPTTNLYAGRVWVDTSVTPNVTKYYSGSSPPSGVTANTWSTDQRCANVHFAVYTAPGTTPGGRPIQPGVYMKGAYIEDLQADKITAGTISAAVSLTAGKLMGGQFTDYVWPTTTGGGYFLDYRGLLLGTKDATESASTVVSGGYYKVVTVGTTDFTSVGGANTAGTFFWATGSAPTGTGTVQKQSYFQATSDGHVYAPGFSIVNGKMTVSQLNVIDTGQIITGAIGYPVGASLASDEALSTSEETKAAVTIDTNGHPVWVHTNFGLRNTSGGGDVAVRLKIGSTVIKSDTYVAVAGYTSGTATDASDTVNVPGTSLGVNATWSVYVASPGTGTLTITLTSQITRLDAYPNDLTGGHMKGGASLFAIGTKR